MKKKIELVLTFDVKCAVKALDQSRETKIGILAQTVYATEFKLLRLECRAPCL
jgi:hypothetical protein